MTMDFNWGKIEKIWYDFSNSHKMTLQDIDQHLLTTKRQIYYSIEKFETFTIHYRYVFFKLDTIDAGNDFRIVIPIDTDVRVKISKPSILTRLIFKKQIQIKSAEKIEINDKTKNLIIDKFRNFKDLKINIGFSPITSMSADKYEKVIEIQTRNLPTDIDTLEKFREFIIILKDYMFDNKLINTDKLKNASA